MKTRAKAKLITALGVLKQIAAGSGASGVPAAALGHGSAYVGISDRSPTGSPSIAGDRLVAAYDMETLTETGELKDFSGNGNHGTIHQTTVVEGIFGKARRFSAPSDKIHLPENPTLALDGPLSVALWVRVRRLGLHQHLVACDDKFAFWITPQNNIRFTDTRGHGFQSAGGIATDTWYSLVGVFSGRAGDRLTRHNIAVILNGKPVEGAAIGRRRERSSHKKWSPGVLHERDACYIGFESHQGEPRHQNFQFEGDIDELLIFSRALTSLEIEVHARQSQRQASGQEERHR